jgi:tetratricopeptide (TPR) repeat protein
MEKLKLLVLILVTIIIVSCNSVNEPKIWDDTIIGIENPSTDTDEDPTKDPNADPFKELDEATSLIYYGKYDEGLVVLYRLVEKYKNHEVGMRALRHIEAVFDIINRRSDITIRSVEVLAILEKYSQGDSKVAKYAYYRTSYRYLSLGEYDKAIEIIKEFNVDDVDGFIGGDVRLYDLGIIYHDYLGNREEAYKYFLELINTYPNSQLAATVMNFYKPPR